MWFKKVVNWAETHPKTSIVIGFVVVLVAIFLL